MATHDDMFTRKCRDRGPDIRALAKSTLEESKHAPEEETYENYSSAPGKSDPLDGLYGFTRPPSEGEELPIQPDRSSAWLAKHPPPHLRKRIREAAGARLEPAESDAADMNGSPEAGRRIRGLMRARELSDPITYRNREKSRGNSRRTPLFDTGLHRWGLGPLNHAEIYDYYQRLDREHRDDTSASSASNVSLLREVLEDDAYARQKDNANVSQWIRKGEIARGGFARVYLWEKKSIDGGSPLRMAVKDSQASFFWQDYHAEGALIRQLNETGCKNVITVLDWLYKPASPSHDAFVRTCYEYAEHGDLEDIIRFYRKHQLVIPEAFIWHVFWSTANALCYCRHGTNKSNNTVARWDTIVHGDVKPANLLLANPDDSVDGLYPTTKLGDFGVAYSVQESNMRLRAWKSTFRYGTNSFMAPEVETVNPQSNGNFHPVPPSNIHGSHSDIWSLGAVIETLMSTRFNALKDHPYFDSPFVEDYYSSRLQNLTAACKTYSIRSRPPIYNVYLRTQTGMTKWHNTALEEASNTPASRPFHSQVLFTKADRERFLKDRAFRNAYIKANRAPLLRGKTPQPQPLENCPKPTAPLSSKPQPQQHLTTPSSVEPLQSQLRAAWAAGDLKGSEQSVTTNTNVTAPSTQPSAFKLPSVDSLHSKIRAAWAAGDLGNSAVSANTTVPSSQSSAFILPDFGLPEPHPSSPSSIRTPGMNGCTGTATATATARFTPTKKTPPPIPTRTKPRSPQQEQQQQPQEHSKRKHSHFEEDMPESAVINEEKEGGGGVVAKRSLKRTGAVRRSKRGKVERRVRFDVDGSGNGEGNDKGLR
ncbi:MAG: hypothetical protein Q9188_003118 [Gyalolechia gomerana]